MRLAAAGGAASEAAKGAWTTRLLVVALLALSCGDNLRPFEPTGDGAGGDGPSFPAAPALGAQIDRMGRPAITTALVAAFRDSASETALKKNAYNAVAMPALFGTATLAANRSVAQELAVNLGVLDVLDQGDPNITNPDGCGDQVLYNNLPMGGGAPMAASYTTLAGLLADDMLYVDTAKTTCSAYLSLELEAAGAPHTQCGGRAPTHDVIDLTYSLLAAGLKGFGPGFIPRYNDGVGPHTDLSDTVFPYFGAPH